jgi:hypothetical protein
MNNLNFYVDKTSQTFADTLIAFGLARLLSELFYKQRGHTDITLQDCGAYYALSCSGWIEQVTIERLATEMLWPGAAHFIRTLKNADKMPEGIPSADYEAAKERAAQYFASLSKASDETNLPERPHPHWDIFRAINPAALPGYNGLLEDWWTVRAAQPEIVNLILTLYSTTPNEYEAAVESWKRLDKANGWGIKAMTTCQQLYNPDQGKGQNRSKADAISTGNLEGFWLTEWLKLVGFYEVALTRQVRGAKDRKTFVITPRELSFAANQQIMAQFVETMRAAESSTRFDILAAIRYTRTLLNYFTAPERQGLTARLGRVQQKIVAGFQTAFYKDLGNATATMNVSFMALPGWVDVSSDEEARIYGELLEELEQLTRQFDESHSHAFDLLQHLRDFVSGDDLSAFFRFTNAFPAYLMSKREQNKYAYQLSTLFIERLIMSIEKNLSRILENEGFQNIAYAIRQSTVTAQYRKKQGDRKYDVRYGLGQELARKSRYPHTFITLLADFLHKYNAENAQIMETRNGPYRRSIKTTDIDEIVRLIDEFGSETVANLLIAYGYARTAREDNTEDESEQE